jgi:DNA primase
VPYIIPPHTEAPTASEHTDAPPAGGTAENKPLDPTFVERFEAKLLRQHPYFAARGLSPALIEHFGLGICPPSEKSIMRNRLVIPIHNERGELLAYAGRWVGPDETIPKQEGKYKLPKGFLKERVLYNLNRVRGRKHLIITEGFFSVFALHQLGVPAIALMGHEFSAHHLDLLGETAEYLTFLLDGDDAGRASVPGMMNLLASSPLRAKFAVLPEGTQPDTVEETILRELLGLRQDPATP